MFVLRGNPSAGLIVGLKSPVRFECRLMQLIEVVIQPGYKIRSKYQRLVALLVLLIE